MKSTTLLFLITLCLTFALSCKDDKKTSDTQDINATSSENGGFKTKQDMLAHLFTSKGEIVLGLEYQKAPMTVANFVGLAEGSINNSHKSNGVPFYDGLKFHRVIKDFMIQTGDPTGTGAGSAGYSFADEILPDLNHDGAGVLSMANSGPGTNSSQFFITHKSTPWLDGKHTVFGKVIKGMNVVNSIEQGDVMDSIRIERNSSEATHFDAPKVFESQKAISAEKQRQAIISKYKSIQSTALYRAFEEYVNDKFPTARKTASGLYIIADELDGPKPKNGSQVKVHYKGTLTNNVVFDESFSKGKPLDFVLGAQQVIPGWDLGIAMLSKGQKGKLIIPPYLAYGESGIGGVIGPNETLIFEVQLLDFK